MYLNTAATIINTFICFSIVIFEALLFFGVVIFSQTFYTNMIKIKTNEENELHVEGEIGCKWITQCVVLCTLADVRNSYSSNNVNALK